MPSPNQASSPNLADARRLLSHLAPGLYTLRDLATTRPELLQAALVVVGEALSPTQPTTFHGQAGRQSLRRTRRAHAESPKVRTRDAVAVALEVDTAGLVRVRTLEESISSGNSSRRR